MPYKNGGNAGLFSLVIATLFPYSHCELEWGYFMQTEKKECW